MKSGSSVCAHIKTDGIRCGSPAMRGRPCCYFHQRYYDGTAIRPDRVVPVRDFPMLTNRSAVNTSITSLLRYTQAGRFTPAETKALMNGIHLAADMLRGSQKGHRRRKR